MTVYEITTTWKKVLERQPRPGTLLFTFPNLLVEILFVRLGEGAPGYGDADIVVLSPYSGTVITLSIPPNTPVYARTVFATVHISCTTIKEMEEE